MTELLHDRDNRYVIMRNGDEIHLDYDATGLPELPQGWQRTFLLYADGFGKDMDPHSAAPEFVTPLPFHGMTKISLRQGRALSRHAQPPPLSSAVQHPPSFLAVSGPPTGAALPGGVTDACERRLGDPASRTAPSFEPQETQ